MPDRDGSDGAGRRANRRSLHRRRKRTGDAAFHRAGGIDDSWHARQGGATPYRVGTTRTPALGREVCRNGKGAHRALEKFRIARLSCGGIAYWNGFHRTSKGAATKRDYLAKNVRQNEVAG